MKYEKYTVWDFVEDDYFVSWANDSNKEADQFWEKWLNHNPQKTEEVQLARHIVNNIEYSEDTQPSERELIDMFENIIKSRQQEEKADDEKTPILFRTFFRYAAAIVLTVGVGLTLWYLNTSKEEMVAEIKVEMIEKNSPRGMKSTIWLSDGTKVRLNSETTLRYLESFSQTERVVYLVGEAFFEVERDENRPFIVQTRGTRTRVLGTTFNMRAYPDESELKVGVVEGKVQVLWDDNGGATIDHTLLPNQMSVINFEEYEARKGSFDPQLETAWKDWNLKFRKLRLKEIFKEIEKWYAVEIVVSHDINLENLYSGSFENEPLKAVLEALGDNAEFDYKISGRRVTVSKQ